MGFFEAVGSVLSKYFTFSGRALRSEYWYWSLFYLLGGIPVSIAAGAGIIQPYVIYSLVTLVPSLSVAARRFHDTNHSGWWTIVTIIPFGWVLMLYWLVKKGDPAENKFGMPPIGSKSNHSSAARAARSTDSSPSEPIPSESRAARAARSTDSSPSESRAARAARSPAASSKNPPDEPAKKDSSQKNPSQDVSSEADDLYFDNRRKK